MVALLGLSAPAFAAPELAISMTHANAYGLQAGECPTGKEEDFPGEPERDCGVDPFSGSGTTFAQESGGNTYKITVRNDASAEALSCTPGTWEGEPTLSYRWLREGVAIESATASVYSPTLADVGRALQCLVTGTNAGGATVSVSSVHVVPPGPSIAAPVLIKERGEPVAAVEEEKEPAVGNALDCDPSAEAWEGEPTFSYQWLRDGVAIEGATASTYSPTDADEGKALQCLVTGTNAGGTTVATSAGSTVIAPARSTAPPSGEAIMSASGGPTEGVVSVADQLPEGVVASGRNPLAGEGWSCQAAQLTCTRSDALAPHTSYPPITLRVHAYPQADSSVTNSATVYGESASPVSATTNDVTTIVPAVPFGIRRFTTNVTNPFGNLFSQAGGHPFAASTSIVFNTTTSDEVSELARAGGQAKALEVDLPPGFIGGPLSTPQCPVTLLKGNLFGVSGCPADTAVGFTDVALGGNVREGLSFVPGSPNTNSEVYNIAPTPGHAAEFGFNVNRTTPIVLYGEVRSDGDYGLTVGDSELVAHPELFGVNLTFCESGPLEIGAHEYACGPVEPGAKPFLTNPTDCLAGPLTTTARLSSYERPEAFTSVQATSPAVDGCGLLQFNPEVEFGPSSRLEAGTTQADEPSGATFALKVPQTNEAGVNATPELKDATVTLPEGMTVDPSAADSLQACSNSQFGLGSTAEPAEPAVCPLASQIGTVKRDHAAARKAARRPGLYRRTGMRRR